MRLAPLVLWALRVFPQSIRWRGWLGLELAAATGVSRGSAHTVPSLLIPERVGGFRLVDLANLTWLDDATDGVSCYRIQGDYRTGRSVIVWIDKATLLLRRVEDALSSGDSVRKTTYNAELNPAIPPEQLRFDAPSQTGFD